MAEGTIARINRGGQFGFIKPDDGGEDVYFRLSWVKGAPAGNIQEGMRLTFESVMGDRGPRAKWVRYAGPGDSSDKRQEKTKREAFQDIPQPGYRFLNPYNFVRYLKDEPVGSDDPVEAQLMKRCKPPPHDRWVGLSGEISCQAEAVTPVFVSDSENVEEGKDQHRSYKFFNINGKKAIPASSLRGIVRSVFETITNSCFANFDATKRLSYRLDTRDARRLVPARIEKQDENDPDSPWVLRLLSGSATLNPEHPPRELYAAPVRQYKARKPSGKQRGTPYPSVDLPKVGSALTGKEMHRYGPAKAWHGKECWAVVIGVKFPPSWRVVAVAADEDTALQMKKEKERLSQNTFAVKRGWLCLTNQNTDNKHSERFFFEDGKPIKAPLPESVLDEYMALIWDYQDRHARTVGKRDKPGLPEDDDMAFSRFILNQDERDLNEGALVYAMLRSRIPHPEVEFIAPVSVPRVAYNQSIGQLLPKYLHRCISEDALCPACRTFGWVKSEKDQEKKDVFTEGSGNFRAKSIGKKDQEKKGAYAGRVYFSNAFLSKKNPQQPMSLEVLGSPKPTTTRFYLVNQDGKPTKGQEDNTIGFDGNDGNNRLRGRKYYRFYRPDPKFLNVTKDKCSDQNRTIKDPEGPGAKFIFTVTFENLASAELGALLWALNIGGKGYHRLGYGKPLGLGSIKISVDDVRLRDMNARCSSLSNSGWREPLSTDIRNHLVTLFQRGITWPYLSFELRADADRRGDSAWQSEFEKLISIQDLLALIGRKEPKLPVHYPYSQDELPPKESSKGKFEWFMGNKRQKGPKWELALPTEDLGLPLIDKNGREY